MSQPKITIYFKTQKLTVTPIMKHEMKNMALNSSSCTQNEFNAEDVINLVSSDEDNDSDKTVILDARPSTPLPKSAFPESFSNVTSNPPNNFESSLSNLNDNHLVTKNHEAALPDYGNSTLTTSKTLGSPSKYSDNKMSTPTSSSEKRRFYSPTKKQNINECTPNSRKKMKLTSMFEYESDIDSIPLQISDTHDKSKSLDAKSK